MKKELDDKLVQDYPKIFANRNKSKYESPMAWGFTCGNGWYNLIDLLCSNIQYYLDDKPEIHQIIADQVKEKFGTLQFYVTGGNDYTRGLIRMAESLSEVICENCGNPGKLMDDGWLKVRCESCL